MEQPTVATLSPKPACPAPAAPAVASRVAGVVVFVALMAIAAQVQVRIPGRPVPFTFQSLVVLLCGLTLPARGALLAMGIYLSLGSVALGFGWTQWSMFTPGSTGLLGPTGGYLAGFLVAAPIVSWIRVRRGGDARSLALAALAGTMVILLAGTAGLSFFVGGVEAAARLGLVPFLPDAAVKLVVAVAATAGWRALARRRAGAE